LIGHAVFVLPVYWLTRNLILCYNVAFLSTFVLLGLGTFLLVRSLFTTTGPRASPRAATVAGIAAAVVVAFNPLRLEGAVASLPAQSIHWLPFALFGVHRYLVTDSRRALVGATVAFIAFGLSATAYLADAALLTGVLVVAEAVRLKRWQFRVWLELWAVAAAVVVVALIGLLPYLEVHRVLGSASFSMRLPLQPILLAVLASGAAWAAARRWPREGAIAVAVALTVYLGSVKPSPMPMDRPLPPHTLAAVPASLSPSAELPAIYRGVEALSSDAVLLELPFGDPAYDLRYMFFAASHGRRLVNGYGRVFPASYRARQQVLRNPLLDPERTAQALSAATHVVVHGAAWPDDIRVAIVRQLEALGGTLVERDADSLLYQMRATERVTKRWIE
jgi:hypothetical protein